MGKVEAVATASDTERPVSPTGHQSDSGQPDRGGKVRAADLAAEPASGGGGAGDGLDPPAIRVCLQHASWLESYVPGLFDHGTDLTVTVSPGTSAAQLCASLDLPVGEIGIHAVNDVRVDADTILKEGDRLKVYPWIIGG